MILTVRESPAAEQSPGCLSGHVLGYLSVTSVTDRNAAFKAALVKRKNYCEAPLLLSETTLFKELNSYRD